MVNCAPKWTKTVNFGSVTFEPKYKISIDFSNTVFVLLETKSQSLYSKFQQDWSIFGGVRPKNPKKGPLHNAEPIQKTENFKVHNHIWYTDETLTTNMYLNKVFQLAKSSSVTHWVQDSVNKTTYQKEPKNQFLTQFWPFLNTSIKAVAYLMHHLVCLHWSKFQTKLTRFSGALAKKPLKSSLKLTVSAGAKTFENWKPESYRLNIIKTCPYASPCHLSFTENWGCQSKGGRGWHRAHSKVHQKTSESCQNLDFNIS